MNPDEKNNNIDKEKNDDILSDFSSIQDDFLKKTLEKINPINEPTKIEKTVVGNFSPQQNIEKLQDKKDEVTIIDDSSAGRTILSRTYEDDLAASMSVTDAKVVQELLKDAREREYLDKTIKKENKNRKWYVFGSILLLLLALGSIGYGAYIFLQLTAKKIDRVEATVFLNTDKFFLSENNIDSIIQKIRDTALSNEKPYIIQMQTNEIEGLPLGVSMFFSVIGKIPPEPLLLSISNVEMGVIEKNAEKNFFILLKSQNTTQTLKELSFIENDLINIFYKSLNIDLNDIDPESLNNFTSEYRENIPVRTLYTTHNDGLQYVSLVYGDLGRGTIVITKNPDILKNIFDTILKQ